MDDLLRYSIHSFLEGHAAVIVGFSGGADSTALMHMLGEIKGLKLIAAHCNFHLRGTESDRDQRHVEEMMSGLWSEHILEVKHFDTYSYAKSRGISIEMAARALRYEWFEQLRETYQASYIVVGHHLDDQVETVLLNLARGTGGRGLVGMDTVSGHIYRPLLRYTRDQILAYLREVGGEYIHDSTNDDDMYRRNYVRSTIVPLFQRLNSNFYQRFGQSLEILREEQDLIEHQVSAFEATVWDSVLDVLDLRKAMEHPHARLLLFRILQKRGFTPTVIDDILLDQQRENAVFFSSEKSLQVELFRQRLFFCDLDLLQNEDFLLTLPIDQEQDTTIGLLHWGVGITSTEGQTLRFSLPCHREELKVRCAQAQDYFRPYGMKRGKKRVFTYLREKGLPSMYRSQVPVLLCGEDIVAVLPFQIDDRYAVIEGDERAEYTVSIRPRCPILSLQS